MQNGKQAASNKKCFNLTLKHITVLVLGYAHFVLLLCLLTVIGLNCKCHVLMPHLTYRHCVSEIELLHK